MRPCSSWMSAIAPTMNDGFRTRRNSWRIHAGKRHVAPDAQQQRPYAADRHEGCIQGYYPMV